MNIVADFLLFLFEVRELSCSSINGYRAAINSVWTVLDRNISADVVVSRLLSAFKIKRPRPLVTVPQWNLAVVLRYLRTDQFDQSAIRRNPKLFAAKTALLLLLALARRCGDVHAIDPHRITWQKDAAVLVPFPGYLPKVFSAAEGESRYQPMIVRGLSRITTEREELKLCPLLNLRAYNDWAVSVAPHRNRFWISTHGIHKPVVKATLSSWVKNIIRSAHATASHSDARIVGARVHELRAIASSLAVQATFKMEDVLNAASWKSSTTFTSFYLRDVSGLQGQLQVIGPCVAAASLIR